MSALMLETLERRMPTYDYRCLDCENEFELSQSFKANTLKKCPKKAVEGCADPGKGNVKKVFGNVGISFKGSGFYKNDSRSGGSGSKSSSESSDSSSSSSSDSKSSDSKKSESKKSESKKSDTKKKSESKASSSSD